MMAFHEDFKLTWTSLLHRTPFPTLEAAISELIFEESHRSTMKMQSPNMVVASTSTGAPKPLSSCSPTQIPSK